MQRDKPLPSVCSLTTELFAHANNIWQRSPRDRNDPLAVWFDTPSATYVRSLERSIRHLFVSPPVDIPPFFWHNLTDLSTLACFYYVALFEAVRGTLTVLRSSNPTWTRLRSKSATSIHLDHRSFNELYLNAIQRLSSYISAPHARHSSSLANYHIEVASADQIPIPDNSVDLILSSPPYCTRIDYAVMSYPELAILGCPADAHLTGLRQRMLGTPTISNPLCNPLSAWGQTCLTLLDTIRDHNSYASRRYYYRYFHQYFQNSLAEPIGTSPLSTRRGYGSARRSGLLSQGREGRPCRHPQANGCEVSAGVQPPDMISP